MASALLGKYIYDRGKKSGSKKITNVDNTVTVQQSPPAGSSVLGNSSAYNHSLAGNEEKKKSVLGY